MAGAGERIVVLGVMSKSPVGGVVWQTMHYLLGFERLGYEVAYVEAHATPPKMFMDDETDRSDRAAAFIARTLDTFGFEGRWAYQALHHDGRCYGMSGGELQRVCRSAALLVNLHGATVLRPEHVTAERIVYLETDPTELQIELTRGLPETHEFLAPHDAFFTFGENYGHADCGLPVSDQFLFRPTRQPVLIDTWQERGPLPASAYTTVGNWRQPWRLGVEWEGDRYTWSKHHEFAKILDVPRRTGKRFELALGHLEEDDRTLLREHGWAVRDALDVSRDHRDYRAFIAASRGEFTVAKDQNIRLRSGWFSDRSATYLAAGRPVITQDTGFGNMLPTGEGLFGFMTVDDVVAAVEAIEADPERHARAAREIAREFFAHDVVLGRLLSDLGMTPPAKRGLRPSARPADLPSALIIARRSRRPTTLEPATEAAVFAQPLPHPTAAATADAGCSARYSIAVVTHGGLAFTRMALESVLANTTAGPYELIVVDNASQDATAEYLRALADRDPRLRPLFNDSNRGFAAANNQALAAATGDVLVLLNNDTIVPPGWLGALERHLDDATVGLVGPVTNEAPNEARIEVEYRTYGQMVGFARERATRLHGVALEIPVATMFCVAMRRAVFEEVGPLDERFGVGLFEDDDYALRIRATGRRILCAQDVFVHHFGQASFGQLVPSGEYGALLAANRRRFEAKWDTSWNGHTTGSSAAYERLRAGVRALIARTVPPEAKAVVISRGDPDLLAHAAIEAWHFPRDADGVYAGHYPAHSAEAIRQLEELRALGAGFLVVPKPSLWWLDDYPAFGRHLRNVYEEAARDESGVVFALERDTSVDSRVVCCVAGMHRSGTSMIAQALAAAGLELGDADDLYVEGGTDNRDGYWEHRRLVALNDRILDQLGGAWDCPPPARDGWWREEGFRELRRDAEELLGEFPDTPRWGWKDPRNSLTLPFWRDLLPDLRIVACLRHPLDVADSLHRRAFLSRRLSLSLWQSYNERILGAGGEEDVLVVDYGRVLADPEPELCRLLAFLSIDATDDAIGAALKCIGPGRRPSEAAERHAENLSRRTIELYERLRAQATASQRQRC